jgi:hypothetical protein
MFWKRAHHGDTEARRDLIGKYRRVEVELCF